MADLERVHQELARQLSTKQPLVYRAAALRKTAVRMQTPEAPVIGRPESPPSVQADLVDEPILQQARLARTQANVVRARAVQATDRAGDLRQVAAEARRSATQHLAGRAPGPRP